MFKKLSDTQTALLRPAAQREDRCLTAPVGRALAQARKTAGALIEAGLVREIRAKGDAPVWRRDDETGCGYSLKLTTAGFKSILVEATTDGPIGGSSAPSEDATQVAAAALAASTEVDRPADKASGSTEPLAIADRVVRHRAGTKIAGLIEMLDREAGVTLTELVTAMGWLPHTTRAALTGLRKRGFVLERVRRNSETRYRIDRTAISATENSTVAAAPILATEDAATRTICGGGDVSVRLEGMARSNKRASTKAVSPSAP